MLTRLFVLGLLMLRAMSGYEIQRFLQLNQTEQWADILPGSIYHALKKLAGEGLIVLQTTEYAGNRSKAIYAVTSAGEEEFRSLLREAWRKPVLHFPSELYAALSFLDTLPMEEVIASINEQIIALQKELAAWNTGEVAKSQAIPSMAMPEYLRAIFTNGREHMEIDIRFLSNLREILPSAPRLPSLPPLPLEENFNE